MQDNTPHALKDKSAQRRRRAMLEEPHMKSLRDFVIKMRTALGGGCDIPDFDPLDGGVNARALFLFESPGGGVSVTDFVSRENPDRVAVLFRNLCEDNGIARKDTAVWNAVPWWVEGGVSREDVEQALPYQRDLIWLLPRLEVIVLSGVTAASLRKVLVTETSARLLTTWMPSPRVFNRWKGKKQEVEETYREVARLLRR